MSIRLKSTEKTPTCVSMRAFLQPISARIYFGKTASHRKRARFVQSRGASPQAYWMSVKAAQRWGCAKRAFCGVCFLMPGGLKRGFFIARFLPRCRGGRPCPPRVTAHFPPGRCGHRPLRIHPPVMRCRGRRPRRPAVGTDDSVRPNSASALSFRASDRVTGVGIRFLRPTARPLP